MAKRANETTKIDQAAAEQCGRIAQQEGRMRAPCLDKTYCQEVLAKYPNNARAVIELGTAFLRGWDAENFAA